MNCVSLASYIEDADLGIRHTSAIAGFRVRLVLVVAVALCRSPTHDDLLQQLECAVLEPKTCNSQRLNTPVFASGFQTAPPEAEGSPKAFQHTRLMYPQSITKQQNIRL